MSVIDDDPKIIQIIPANGWYEITEDPAEPDCPIVVPIMFWALREDGEVEGHTELDGVPANGDYLYDPLREQVFFYSRDGIHLGITLKMRR